MYTLATAFGLIDVALALVILLACAYYIMFLSDGKYTPTNAPASATAESTSGSTSDKKEGESSSSGDIDTSKIGGNPNFDGQGKKERKKLVEKILAEWPKKYGDKVTKKRKKLVQAAVDSLGVTLQYSQSSSFRQVNPKDTPTCTDCSGFVCWCYYKAGYNNVGGYTGGMKDSFFKKISEDELLPGDVGFSNDLGGTSGSSDHTGLFIGELDGQYYFIHCTSNGQVIQYGSDGVAQKHGGTKVNTAGDAHLPCFWRLKEW